MAGNGETAEPVAVGYLRSLSADGAQLDDVADRLAEHGTRAGYAVWTVYRDEGGDDAQDARAGFRALMAEVRSSDVAAIIVPSPAHMSLRPDVRRWMKHLLDAAGVELVVMPQLALGVATVRTLQPLVESR